MGSFSKFYEDQILKGSCQSLLFHTDSCPSHLLRDIFLFARSNFKYFAPVCLIPALIKWNRMDKKTLQNTLEYYIGSALIGTAVGFTTNFFICLFRSILGQFSKYTFLFWPAFIGGCTVNFGSPRIIQLFETSMFQCSPLLIQWLNSKITKEKILHALIYFLKTTISATFVGWSTVSLICVFRNILGHFNLYALFFIPATIGGCFYNFTAPRVKDLFETSMFQCNIESFFLAKKNFVSRLIGDSRVLQTYLFMLCSALILQGKRLYNLKGFWLLSSNPKISEKENCEQNKCELHKQSSCSQYIFEGIRKYFALGLTLDLVKTLMSKVHGPQIESKILGKLKNFRIRSTALLTVYVGIYRFAHCILNRYLEHTDSLNHLTSAFLAGCCYYSYPQSTLFSYAIVQAIRTIWSIVKIENGHRNNLILHFLFRIPFGKILFPLALANSVHLVCLKPKYCSRLTDTITNGVTNNYPNHIKHQIYLLQQRYQDQMPK